MKILASQTHPARAQSGSAVVVVLAMLGIMVICVSVNVVSVRTLQRELKLIEKKQVQRLQPAPSQKPAATGLSAENRPPHD